MEQSNAQVVAALPMFRRIAKDSDDGEIIRVSQGHSLSMYFCYKVEYLPFTYLQTVETDAD